MNIVICDDDEHSISIIQKYIISYFRENHLDDPVLYTFSSAEVMLKRKHAYDIAFLDVEMPGISGITAVSTLRQWNKDVIVMIVTGFSDAYLDESFEINVYRYITKPINEFRFRNNLKSALKKYGSKASSIYFDAEDGSHSISSNDIIFVCTDKRKTIVYTENHTYITNHNISYWKSLLPKDHFIESYKGHIVNFKYISAFHDDEIELWGTNKKAYMARRKAAEIKRKYLLYLELCS